MILTDVSTTDTEELIKMLRPIDRQEGRAMHGSGYSARTMIERSVDESHMSFAVRDDSFNLLACFGFADAGVIGHGGIPWMLGTKHIKENSVFVVKTTKYWCEFMLATRYNTLSNMVWDKNKTSIKYLETVGFKMGDRIDLPTGEGAFEFSMVRKVPHV